MDFFDILLAKKLKNDKDVSIVQLNVSKNGTYSESGKAYSPVVVDIQPPSNSYLRTPIDSYPTTAEQLPIPKCDVEIANQKSCKVFVSNKPFVNDKVPYLFRKSAGGDRVYEKLIGGTIAWNQLVQSADTSCTLPNIHRYIARISGTWSIGTSDGTAIAVDGSAGDMVFDITQMFGSTIADYIYSLEQTTAGAGVAWFRQMFPNDYYAYDSGSLQSVNVASKKVYDSNNTLVATYTFDSDVTLRGVPKLVDNKIQFDGDIYESTGKVTRRYGIVDLGTLKWSYDSSSGRFYTTQINIKATTATSYVINALCSLYSASIYPSSSVTDKVMGAVIAGRVTYFAVIDSAYSDATAFKSAMSGVMLVYELATPTTESADPYTNPQIVDADGTEEFVDYAYSQSTRDVAVPVGHNSLYYNGQLYQTDFAQATTDTINMAELHSIVPPSGEFYITSNGTLSVDVWKK